MQGLTFPLAHLLTEASLTATLPSPFGNFGPQKPDFDLFLAAVTGTRGPLGADWRPQTARRRLAANHDRLTELREQAVDRARAAGRDPFNPGSWASGAAFAATDNANLFGIERDAFEAAIVDATWAIVVEDLMPDEADELYAAVEPSLGRARFWPPYPEPRASVEP